MSESPATQEKFLLDQRLSLLDRGVSDPLRLLDLDAHRELRDHGGFQDHKKDSPWKDLPRNDWLAKTCPRGELHRSILVGDAGLGKTTNGEWFEAMLPDAQPSQLAFFLPIEDLPDDPNEVFDELLKAWRLDEGCTDKKMMPSELALRCLRSRRDAGQLTLFLDSLDQALSKREAIKTLKFLLTSDGWRHCPIVVSTRPHALTSKWDDLFAAYQHVWRFIRVEQLDKEQQRFLLGTVPDEDDPEPDPKKKRQIHRYDLLPPEGRSLLGVPRMIEILRKAGNCRKDYENLKTAADVYWKCTSEMILEGLKAPKVRDKLGRSGQSGPVDHSYSDVQLEIALNILGAVAFEMFVNASQGETKNPRPNRSHVSKGATSGFLTGVYNRLLTTAATLRSEKRPVEAGRLGVKEDDEEVFRKNFSAVADLNAGQLENFFLDKLGRHGDIRWRNPTMQAFFAASWVCRHGSPDDFALLRKWIVHFHDDIYGEYEEFWRFASELAGTTAIDPSAVRCTAWIEVMAPLYDGKTRDEKDQPIRSTEFIYRSWDRMEETRKDWDEKKRGGPHPQVAFLAEFPAIRAGMDCPEKQIADNMMNGFLGLVGPILPGDRGTYEMGSDKKTDPEAYGDGKRQTVTFKKPFQLHSTCVTNREFELFNPNHKNQRWWDYDAKQKKSVFIPHPLAANGNEHGDDDCPVVIVTWYDAWCYAKWCGASLPEEKEWEYARRAGWTSPYSMGIDQDENKMTTENCNFGGKIGHTIPVKDEKKRNRWGFYQMAGNVYEWCDDWYDSEHMLRVLRGGSWDGFARFCRAALRYRLRPTVRISIIGFRLSLPGP